MGHRIEGLNMASVAALSDTTIVGVNEEQLATMIVDKAKIDDSPSDNAKIIVSIATVSGPNASTNAAIKPTAASV